MKISPNTLTGRSLTSSDSALRTRLGGFAPPRPPAEYLFRVNGKK